MNVRRAASLEKCGATTTPSWEPNIAIQAKKWRFTRSLVEDAPAHAGVYALWRDASLLHLGCARGGETIRDKLLAHLGARDEARPTHYSWEIATEPLGRAWEIARQLEARREPDPSIAARQE